jgi:hypothetical protein
MTSAVAGGLLGVCLAAGDAGETGLLALGPVGLPVPWQAVSTASARDTVTAFRTSAVLLWIMGPLSTRFNSLIFICSRDFQSKAPAGTILGRLGRPAGANRNRGS